MRRAVTFLFFWVLFATVILGMFAVTVWYWETRKVPVEVSLLISEIIGPRDSLTLRFSRAVQPQSFQAGIHIQPAQPLRLEWQADNMTLLLFPETNWPIDSQYRLSVGEGKTQWFGTTPAKEFHITGPSYPKVVSIFPEPESQDVLLGIEDPLRVTFDRSVKDFFIDFRLEPKTDVVYQNNPEKTTFDILPKVPLQSGTQHTLAIYAKWRGESDQTYQFITKTVFATLPPAPKVANRDLALRIEEAKRFTEARKTTGKYIDINLKNQIMTLFENGQALDAYLISSGKRGMDTPTGEFAIQNKANRPWSKRYSLYMPYWQAITPDGLFGIHELPEWPSGYKEGANHLGTPVSHGCVRLGVGAAERVYAWTEVGTPIVIY